MDIALQQKYFELEELTHIWPVEYAMLRCNTLRARPAASAHKVGEAGSTGEHHDDETEDTQIAAVAG
jgi:hypothetical protein